MTSWIFLSVVFSFACLCIFTPSVVGHGYAIFPKARQVICHEQGGHWSKNIPNKGCQAAYDKTGVMPFTQINEYATLIKDYNNMDSVKASVRDGLICSGGDPSKSGMSVASAYWERTEVTAGETLKIKFYATAPHNPNFFQVYLSKPGYEAQVAPLNWSDLDLIIVTEDIPVGVVDGKKTYMLDVSLPAGRSGNATMMIRWQRVDPAGEGFYNCLDLKFVGGSEAAPISWASAGVYIKEGLQAEAGQNVWFRVFSPEGKEMYVDNLAISSANEGIDKWGVTLANNFNSNNSRMQIGVLQDDGSVAFEASEIYKNHLYSKVPDHTHAIDVHASEDLPPVPVPDPSEPGNKPPATTPPKADFTYPEGLGTYIPGVTVVVGVDGKAYKCQPFPNGAWCNNIADAYAPGKGPAFTDCWDEQ